MTSKEWIDKAKEHEVVLLKLIARWHPASSNTAVPDMPITAELAEQMCQKLRLQISGREKYRPAPQLRFMHSLLTGNADEAYSIISNTWLGVPESTSCWELEGFKEAVDLLEDPPDDLVDPEEAPTPELVAPDSSPTGRLTASKPNLQNIPIPLTDEAPHIKAFIGKPTKGSQNIIKIIKEVEEENL